MAAAAAAASACTVENPRDLRHSGHRHSGASQFRNSRGTHKGTDSSDSKQFVRDLGTLTRSMDSREARSQLEEALRAFTRQTDVQKKEEEKENVAQTVIKWMDHEVRSQLKLIDLKLDHLSQQFREMPSSSRYKLRSHLAHPTHASKALADKEAVRPIGLAKLGAAEQSPATSPRTSPREMSNGCPVIEEEPSTKDTSKTTESSPQCATQQPPQEVKQFQMMTSTNSKISMDTTDLTAGDIPFNLENSGNDTEKEKKNSACVAWHPSTSENFKKDKAASAGESSMVGSHKTSSRRSMGSSLAQISGDISKIIVGATGSMLSYHDEDGVSHKSSSKRLSVTTRAVWMAIEDVESNAAARWYSKTVCVFVLFTVLISMVQTALNPPIKGVVGAVFETSFDVIFIFDFLIRFMTFPKKRRFLGKFINVIDFICCVPVLIFRAYIGFVLPPVEAHDERMWSWNTFMLCVVPVLRVLKIIRHLRKFHLLVMSWTLCIEALPTLLYALGVLTMAFAGIIYVVEPSDNIESLPRAIWLTMVTMTTVGYGDTTPKSTAGSVVVSLLVISSVLFMAMPLGIIGQAFNEIWKDRDRILVAKQTGERLLQWGYTAKDIPFIFESYSKDGSGELDFSEFHDMISKLDIGLSDNRILELFQAFDGDDSGSIDAGEFIRILFPKDFLSMYRM